jgi:hypothetical protein
LHSIFKGFADSSTKCQQLRESKQYRRYNSILRMSGFIEERFDVSQCKAFVLCTATHKHQYHVRMDGTIIRHSIIEDDSPARVGHNNKVKYLLVQAVDIIYIITKVFEYVYINDPNGIYQYCRYNIGSANEPDAY